MRDLNCRRAYGSISAMRSWIHSVGLVLLLGGPAFTVHAQAPHLVWSRSFGGPGDQWGSSIVADGVENLYVTGGFDSTAIFGTYNLTTQGGHDVFLAKLTVQGDVVWARPFGGAGDEFGGSVAADAFGRVYLGMNAGGPMIVGTDTVDWGMVVAGLGPNGSTRWIHQPTSSREVAPAWINDLTIGASDDLIAVGSVQFEASFGAFTVTSSGGDAAGGDILVVRYSLDGLPEQAARAGSSGMDDAGLSVAVDSAGNSYVLGIAADSFTGMSDQCPVTTRNFATFVGKLDGDANPLWGFCIVDPGWIAPEGYDAATDRAGNLYITGSMRGLIGEEGTPLLSDSSQTAVLAKFDTEGRLIWAVPADNGTGISVALDSFGNVHILKGLPSGQGELEGYNEDGEKLYALMMGAPGFLAADDNGNLYVTGAIRGTTTISGKGLTADGGTDILVAKFDVSEAGVANESESRLPKIVRLYPNYPNPFTRSTTLSFAIPSPTRVDLRIYDVLGREVAHLLEGYLTPGRKKVIWNASDYPPGIYFCRLSVDGQIVQSQRLVLLR